MSAPEIVYRYDGSSIYTEERKNPDQVEYIRADVVKELKQEARNEVLRELQQYCYTQVEAMKNAGWDA